MRGLLALCALLQIARSSCPAKFSLVKDGECRGLGARDTSLFEDAASKTIEICKGFQGKPMIIHDEEHQLYWRNRVPNINDGYSIMGLVCNSKNGKWEWSDGSVVDYKPSKEYYNAELNKICSPGSWYLQLNGTWSFGTSGNIKTVNFCTTQLQKPTPEEAGCDEEDAVCYPIIQGNNWQNGQETCMRLDANIASIHSKEENAFVRRQAVIKGATNGVFIGAKAGSDGKFKWIDGTEMDYENYAPGFPKKNFGDCVALDTTSTTGQWMNIDCNAKLSAACAIKKEAAKPTCTGEDYEEGAIITSPGFPFSASTRCDYFISIPPGSSKRKIELNILSLESNSCCDVLTVHNAYLGGVKIGELSGVAANKTITSTSGLMRISWLPDGGVNVRGLMMTFKFV